MHRWDPQVPLEETLRALEKLVADGKVLYLGASNWAAWQISKALGIAEKTRLAPDRRHSADVFAGETTVGG